jgi:NAD(P)-dependent dehydrogenase (short-subunit alcohol dehydrogenase family)
MVAKTMETFGRIDILMNNAGIGENVNAKIDEMPEEVFDKVVAVNLRGVFLGIKYGVPQLRARGGGRIINTASIAGMGGLPRSCAYAASKAGVINLTKTAALEYARHNIRVNCICPGYADTAILDTGRDDTSQQQVREMLSKRLPVRRLGQAEEVAQTALYLAAGPDFVTGTSLVIDGGIRAM